MATYQVRVTQTSTFIVTVEAEGPYEAMEKAEDENPHGHEIIALDETEMYAYTR